MNPNNKREAKLLAEASRERRGRLRMQKALVMAETELAQVKAELAELRKAMPGPAQTPVMNLAACLPCPFCAGTEVNLSNPDDGKLCVSCFNCGTDGPFANIFSGPDKGKDWRVLAKERWNKRKGGAA